MVSGRERSGVSPPSGNREIARHVPDLEAPMANKPFKEITDRDLFAGLVLAAFPASSDREN
jgi:hypothetical protein